MNILLTSVGRRSYLVEYFKQALEICGVSGKVFAANSSDDSPAFLVADEHVVTPIIYDDSYISFLTDYCKENQIDVMVSLFDIDLPILAKNREKFEEIGVRLVVSDYEMVEICNDKWATYKFLLNHGFAAPKTYIAVEDVKEGLANGEIDFPIIIKPRWGCGSIGIFRAENLEELEVLGRKCRMEIQKSYLKYESGADVERSVLFQEYLTADEYGLDVINNMEGEHLHTVAKRKVAMRAGETDIAETVDDHKLSEVGERLSLATKHIGNLDVDILRIGERDYVLEMNARFGGGYPFSHIAGINLPAVIVAWISGREVKGEWLREGFGVRAQKDIKLVRLK